MKFKPSFPTKLHQDTAELIRDYFLAIGGVDTILVVNSCARGQALPESDLDFAILVETLSVANISQSAHAHAMNKSLCLFPAIMK